MPLVSEAWNFSLVEMLTRLITPLPILSYNRALLYLDLIQRLFGTVCKSVSVGSNEFQMLAESITRSYGHSNTNS